MSKTGINRFERLEELARERWGEKWAIQQKHWADGSTTEHAYHMRGLVDVEDVDGRVHEKELLFLNDEGQHVVERIQVQVGATVDREVVADPYDLVDESEPLWSWVKDRDDQWHRVVDDGNDELTLACGDVLEEAEIDQKTTGDLSATDDLTVEKCESCKQADHDG
ncbi:hypothetical protein [Halosolutus halophilus]|uniref:hypothetical protein n=1 Tax=Halosolutus halophilus TaxID=1552990 RepID=UPI002234EF37|nr:hypothetical protein [Halosolutus halophilus]